MENLNSSQRERIKTIYAENNTTMRELAYRFGVATKTIHNIIHEMPIDISPNDEKRVDIIRQMIKYNLYTKEQIKHRFGISIESMDKDFEYILTPVHLDIIRKRYAEGWTISMIATDTGYHPLLIEEIVTCKSKFLTPFKTYPLGWSGQSHIVDLYLTGKYSTKEIAFIIATAPYDVGQVIAHRGQGDKDRARINREKYLMEEQIVEETN
jgi:predicted DNA-binding protein YlxM (UPF0122 family)